MSSTPVAPGSSPAPGAPETPPAGGTRDRIGALDVLRGFALCGIIFVNIGPLTGFRTGALPEPVLPGTPAAFLELFVAQRFFPIFSLLFGIGFSLVLRSARRRSARPRLVLVRRLAVLLVLGVAFQFVQPGAALLPYAVFGLLVLLPSTWLPRPVVAAAAAVGIVVALLFADGGYLLIPGVFLLGSALTRHGVVDRIDRIDRIDRGVVGPAVLLGVSALVAVPALLVQATELNESGFSRSSAIAGFALAAVYVALLLLLLQTPLRGALLAVFSPLGRMALTNYVSAAALMLLAGAMLSFHGHGSWPGLFAVCVGVLLVQWSWSVVWLRHRAQGPLEAVWRRLTWGPAVAGGLSPARSGA